MSNNILEGNNRRPFLWRMFFFSPYICCGLVLIILGLPSVLPTYLHSMLTKVLIFAIFAMSLDLILGYTGLLSLGHAAFFGMAGYAAGILMVHYGIESLWLIIPLGILTAGISNGHVRLHGPGTIQPGSSLSHWSTALSPNQVMEPSYTGPDHDGTLELALFEDIGWPLITDDEPAVPSASPWGLVILALVLVSAGAFVQRRRSRSSSEA